MYIGEPSLKEHILPNVPFRFTTTERIKLEAAKSVNSSFLDVLESRKSSREFAHLDLAKLGAFLYLSNRIKRTDCNELGQEITYTNCASPGAMNALHLLLRRPSDRRWYSYDPLKHELGFLGDDIDCDGFIAHMCHELIPATDTAWIIWNVADLESLKCKYQNPQSLAYRHSGGISATHALVAQALGLSYCQLGIMGEPEASKLSDKRELLGVGLAFLGDSPDNSTTID